jgi:hypothetical protein
MATANKKPSQADKMECIQRIHLHASPINSCAKRYGVSANTVKKWVKLHENGALVKRHPQWDHHWEGENFISHFVDLDVLQSIKRGQPTYEDSIISLFDPELDAVNGLAHLEWSPQDILKLCLWMVDRSLELIRDVGLNTDDFREEMAFIESPFFEKICVAFGYDVEDLRKGVFRHVAERAELEDEKQEVVERLAMKKLLQAPMIPLESIQASAGYMLPELSLTK